MTSVVDAAPGAVVVPTQTRRRRPVRVRLMLFNLLALLVFAGAAFPVYWMVSSSLLPANRIRATDPTWFPAPGTLEHYRRVFTEGSFTSSLRISLLVTAATLLIALVFAFLAALAISRFRFTGRRQFVIAVLLIQMIPAEGLFISQYKMLEGWNLLNSVAGLTLVYVAGVLPFTIWTLRGFVDGIPIELEEAAMVDGCSRTRAFFSITFPLLAPGLVATGVFAFIQAWNEFTLALVVMTRPDNHTLPIWLRAFTDVNRATDWGGIMAGSTLIAMPVVIFFLVVQGRMATGLVSGAVKG